jgi:glutamyl-Q tRNA(Asp) synthetase
MYRGRFAPSPTGALHAGSLVAALASWLDARAHAGQWLLRMEDVDTPRCVAGADAFILQQLAACHLVPDEAPVWQSQRRPHYQAALDTLLAQGLAYPCACSRKDIATQLQHAGVAHTRHQDLVYPGTCRNGLGGRSARAWRLRTDVSLPKLAAVPVDISQAATKEIASSVQLVQWCDRRMGEQTQDVARDVGDFVLLRADGPFAYQLAVVVDDAAHGITHVVRGEDLADNTARQILLQQHLQLLHPVYLHTPLVLGNNGEKLSKQNGATAIDTSNPEAALSALNNAARCLELPQYDAGTLDDALARWTAVWFAHYPPCTP